MKLAGKMLGWLVTALGLSVLLIGLLAIFDPQGAQHANDSDPFGTPPSIARLWMCIAIGAAMAIAGLWLASHKSDA